MTMFCDCGNPEAHRGEHIPKPVTDTPLDPDAVRALCDAADEVERLRIRLDRALINWRSARRQRDASRTAHAALVAELRALRSRSGYVLAADVLSLLDRHAPTTGATP